MNEQIELIGQFVLMPQFQPNHLQHLARLRESLRILIQEAEAQMDTLHTILGVDIDYIEEDETTAEADHVTDAQEVLDIDDVEDALERFTDEEAPSDGEWDEVPTDEVDQDDAEVETQETLPSHTEETTNMDDNA